MALRSKASVKWKPVLLVNESYLKRIIADKAPPQPRCDLSLFCGQCCRVIHEIGRSSFPGVAASAKNGKVGVELSKYSTWLQESTGGFMIAAEICLHEVREAVAEQRKCETAEAQKASQVYCRHRRVFFLLTVHKGWNKNNTKILYFVILIFWLLSLFLPTIMPPWGMDTTILKIYAK